MSDFLQSRSDLSSLSTIVRTVEQEGTIHDSVYALSQEGQIPALWLQVLLNLTSITTDQRAEVRNSSVQTIQRIFENNSEQLSAEGWLLCLRIVLFDMIEANLDAQRETRAQDLGAAGLKEWNETTSAVLQTLSILITAYMEKLDASQFSDAWSELLDRLQQYFECGSHTLAASVFAMVSGVLSHTVDAQRWNTSALLKTAVVWNSYFASREAWADSPEHNQEAFVAYADAFKALYRLTDDSLSIDLPSMLANLEACIVISDEEAYSSDVDSMTVLQRRVVDCLDLVKTEQPGLPSYLIQLLSRLVLLPYTTFAEHPERRGPTFVALSKASMTLLQKVAVKHIDQTEIYTSAAILAAFNSLAKPIQEKYIWQQEGKLPTLWQKSTTTVLAILESALPRIKSDKEIWMIVVDIAHYITRARVADAENPPSSLRADELFDMGSFKKLRDLITIPLGSPSLPDALRRTYTRNLFTTSLGHTPLPGELPDLTSAPLEDLYKIRLGQTAELELSLRTKSNQTCLSELFDLVAVHDSTAERIKLAQAAAPYVILRSALSLKTYIADQPLRGRMPMPGSQRRELLLVLHKLAELQTEPQAIPDAPGIRSKHRKHLHRLYPLLLKALRVARQDVEVFEHLSKLTDMVGDDFGLDDD